ncbi:sensor histidine kinase [Parasphingorhabdus pacifica]
MKKADDGPRNHRDINRRLTRVVLIPSAVLIVLWLLISTVTVYDGLHLRSAALGIRNVSIPAMELLASAQHERALSLRYLDRPELDRAELDRRRERTDRSLAKLRAATGSLVEGSPADVRTRMRALDRAVAELPAVRSRIDSRQAGEEHVHADYDELIRTGSELFETQARTVPDPTAGQNGLLANRLFGSSDRMFRSASLVSTGMSTGEFTARTHAEYARAVGAYHRDLESTAEDAPPHVRERYRELVASPAWKRLVEWEDLLIGEGEWAVAPELPFTEQEWLNTTRQVADELTGLTVNQAEHASDLALQDGNDKLVASIVGSLVTLVAVATAILAAARVARRIATRLVALQQDTLDLADTRLPEIVERLRRGELVEVESEIGWLDHGKDEIGLVADAFNAAQRTAIAAAVREAHAKDGANHVFLGIAHRSQTLMHRQLQLLDELERQEEDPGRMEKLFQLDHLATRARRNAENLIILGGERPGRKWSKPIDLADVVGSAIAETKHYARVRTERIAHVALVGAAVADTVHLIAELIDNATAFSPQHSQVTVLSQTVAKGVAIEVEDHGPGMDEPERNAANAMFDAPPEFDAMALRDDTRLGLFVVARLAAKHGIGVELRTSAYGGTRAVVLLPNELTVSVPEPPANGDTDELDPVPTAPAGPAGPAADDQAPGSASIPDHRAAETPVLSATADPAELLAFRDEPAEEFAGIITAFDDRITEPVLLRLSGGSDGHGGIPAHEQWPTRTPADTTGDDVRWPDAEPPEDPRPSLPRRHRQASLAPQLRGGATTTTADAEESAPGRSADEIRRLMASFQRSTERARAEESLPRRGKPNIATDSED